MVSDSIGASERGQKHGEVRAHLFTSLGSCHGESGSHEVTSCKRKLQDTAGANGACLMVLTISRATPRVRRQAVKTSDSARS